MEVIKPLHLTPLFDRAPDGPSAYSIVQLDNGGTSDITHWVLAGTCVSNIHEPLLLTHCLTHYSVSIASFRSIRTSGILIEDK